jgi:hypothetical protein
MALRAGDRVHQHTYGLGEIIETNRVHVTIEFDDGVTRKFASAIVQLEPTVIPRPPRAPVAGRSRARLGTPPSRRVASSKGAAS